jgi:signal transduction histidine kinase
MVDGWGLRRGEEAKAATAGAGLARPLRALLVEDSADDAALVRRELRRAGYALECEVVDTEAGMEAALAAHSWDVILSDYHLPRFGALEAWAVVQRRALDVPFIIVSGTVGEELAVEAMRLGVHDYLLKDSLTRLAAAVDREMREAALRAERHRMQEQLLISDRMASVGTLAAGVAHEINNPLAAVLANLDVSLELLADLCDPRGGGEGAPPALTARLGDLAAPLVDAREAADRVQMIVRDLKIFSRSGDEERTGPVDIERVLESALRIAWNEVRHRARLLRDYGGDVPLVLGNAARLGQVFLNLIVNAAQAIPEGQVQANEIRVVSRRRGDQVVIEVRDSGSGIPPQVMSHIFAPFFTTKSAGVGTGLGLAICHRIVTGLGGTITARENEGPGTIFEVVLAAARPVEDLPPAPLEPVVAAAAAIRGRILVVDDEPLINKVVQRMLRADHDVSSFGSVREALEAIRGGASYDVILCDLMMPEMTGMDLHAELLRLRPDLAQRVVFMTGGAFTPAAREYLHQMPNQRLEKPFEPGDLRLIVEAMLADPPPPFHH